MCRLPGGSMKLVFLDPGRSVGGSNVLFARLARLVNGRDGLSAAVVDYVDGFVANDVQGAGVEVRPFLPGERVAIGAGEVLIAPLSHLWMMIRQVQLDPEARCIFWNIHPNNLLVTSPLHYQLARVYPERAAHVLQLIEPGLRGRVRALVEGLHRAGGLIEMDTEVHRSNAILFGARFEPHLVPIPIRAHTVTVTPSTAPAVYDRPLRLGWLGRLSTDKTPSLLATLANVEAFAQSTGARVEFHIIGDGSQANRILRRIRGHNAVDYYMAGTRVGAELDRYLLETVDVLFAMGTSCLEGARLGLPSVLVDAAIWSVPPKLFRYCWLFETRGYCLGRIWTPRRNPYPYRMDQILTSILDESQRKAVGEQCRAYVAANHDIERIGDALVSAASRCECGPNVIDFSGLLRLGALDRVLASLKDAWVRARSDRLWADRRRRA